MSQNKASLIFQLLKKTFKAFMVGKKCRRVAQQSLEILLLMVV